MHPVDLDFLPQSIASGMGHSLAICKFDSSDNSGDTTSLASWGWNRSFQLGREGPEDVPLIVEELLGQTPISASGGRAHSMVLTAKKELWTWGSGRNGRLGLGWSGDEGEPTLVEYLNDFEVLHAVAGFDHSLVLVAD